MPEIAAVEPLAGLRVRLTLTDGVDRLLVVVFVDRGRIRIISTRRATPFGRLAYEEARR